MSRFLLLCAVLVACAFPAAAKKLVLTPDAPCGGMPVTDDNPTELLPLLSEGDGWTLLWKATCTDMGGAGSKFPMPRSRVLAARYGKGSDAVAVTLAIDEESSARGSSSLNMSPAAAEYAMVKPIQSEKIIYAGHEAYTGVLGGMGDYRQDVLDVMLSANTILRIQREYKSSQKPMDMVQWADDVLKVNAYVDPAWVR